MSCFLDTDILIDCLRGVSSAHAWLDSTGNEEFCVPGIVVMEVLAGCRSKSEMNQCLDFLARFDVAWPEATEFARACDLLAEHRLSSGISIPDCLIAAMALTRSACLYTFNTKHFQVIPDLNVRQPYSRPAS